MNGATSIQVHQRALHPADAVLTLDTAKKNTRKKRKATERFDTSINGRTSGFGISRIRTQTYHRECKGKSYARVAKYTASSAKRVHLHNPPMTEGRGKGKIRRILRSILARKMIKNARY